MWHVHYNGQKALRKLCPKRAGCRACLTSDAIRKRLARFKWDLLAMLADVVYEFVENFKRIYWAMCPLIHPERAEKIVPENADYWFAVKLILVGFPKLFIRTEWNLVSLLVNVGYTLIPYFIRIQFAAHALWHPESAKKIAPSAGCWFACGGLRASSAVSKWLDGFLSNLADQKRPVVRRSVPNFVPIRLADRLVS